MKNIDNSLEIENSNKILKMFNYVENLLQSLSKNKLFQEKQENQETSFIEECKFEKKIIY